jgi:hypothetical protein
MKGNFSAATSRKRGSDCAEEYLSSVLPADYAAPATAGQADILLATEDFHLVAFRIMDQEVMKQALRVLFFCDIGVPGL